MRFALIVALLSAVSACQPLPHPFADDMPPPNSDLMTPPDSASVMVAPVTGAPAATAQALAAAMATALQNNDVPASTEARNRGSYLLQGQATATDAGGGKLRIAIAWEMISPNGSIEGRQQTDATLPQAAWGQGGDGVGDLASRAAPMLAKLIETKAPPPVASSDPLIAIHPATGASGDGGQALATAMAAALRRAQVALADYPGAAPSFIVEAKVAVAPAISGQQKVSISWRLRRPDGTQIGQVNQENAVDAGSLDRVWGLTAYDAANAAAPGIEALIAQAKRSAAAGS
ncbi:MAG TPA: hypothetical protein VNF99_10130 [Stellaceae bacterium]|nr:hypothetical protein [Stellaceae bacterium]